MSSNNSSAASTVLDPLGRNKVQIDFEVFFAVLICLVAILGNFLVAFVINKAYFQLKNITNVFIHNLVWTDICMAALVMPFWIISLYNGRWIFSAELCEWTATIRFTLLSASEKTISLIAVNRYLKIVKPNIYPKFFPSIRMARAYCVCMWLWAVLVSTPPLYGWGQYAYHERDTVCGLVSKFENIFYVIVHVGVSACGTFGIIVFCYYKIYRTVKVSTTNLSSHAAQHNLQNTTMNNTAQTTDIKMLKSTFTVVCAFVLCYAPASVFFVCEVIFGSPPRLLSAVITYLMFCSSGINPIIYGLMNPQVKRAISKVLRCKTIEQEINETNQIVGTLDSSGRTSAVQPMVLEQSCLAET